MEHDCVQEAAGASSAVSLFLVVPFHIFIAKILVKDLRLFLPRHKILFSLSVSDCWLIGLSAIISLLSKIFQLETGASACTVLRKTFLFNATLMVFVSSFSLVALSVERYIACVHSFRLHQWLTDFRVNCALVLIWVLGASLGVYTAYCDDNRNTELIVGEATNFQVVVTVTVFITSTIITWVQITLFRLSRAKMSQVQQGSEFGRNAEVKDLRRRQIKVAVVSAILILAYGICMLPVAFLFFLHLTGKHFSVRSQTVAIVFGMMNNLMDPYIYGLGVCDTRRAIMKNIKWIRSFIFSRE
eukprot:gene16810-8274_t